MPKKKSDSFTSRPIDLDLLFYNDIRISNDILTLPHPRIGKRPFVLKPLLDIQIGSKIDKNLVTIDVKKSLKRLIGSDNIYSDSFKDLNKIIYIKSKDLTLDLSTKKYLSRTIYCTEDNVTERGIYTDFNLKRENDHARVLNYVNINLL